MNTTTPLDRAVSVRCSADYLEVELEDGRIIKVPLEWFPRLRDASPEARGKYRMIGRGIGISWPDLDEDISVAHLLQPRLEEGEASHRGRGVGTGPMARFAVSSFGDNVHSSNGTGKPTTDNGR